MLIHIFFVFIFTLILVALLVPVGGYGTHHSVSRRRYTEDEKPLESERIGAGLTMLFFFFILFPLILAGSSWVTPYGPVAMGVSWMPILVIGILLTLLIAAISPRRPKKQDKGDLAEDPVELGASALFGLTFFILMIGAFGVIIAGIL